MTNPFELREFDKNNYQTILHAAENGCLALVSCEEKGTGKMVPTLCAVNFDGKNYEFVPLARLFDENPYELLNPPAVDDANHS